MLDYTEITRGQHTQQPVAMFVASGLCVTDIDDSLVLDPPFQRGSVWTLEQRQAWIESILYGIPLPAIFINRWPYNRPHPIYTYREIVIDGKQRIEATRDFMADGFTVRGEKWSEQPIAFQRRFRMSSGICDVIYTQFKTMAECARLYLMLLRAGTAHTPEEIKNAEDFIQAATGAGS